MFHIKTSLELDLQSICRICLQKDTELFDLFHESEASLAILEKISLCFQIILNAEKYLPCVICKKCIEELEKANTFRIKCLTMNERFKDYCDKQMHSLELDAPSTETDIEGHDHSLPDSANSCEINSTNVDTRKESNFQCDLCNKVLKSMKSLLKHIVSMHEKRRHIGRVSGFGPARRYHCTTCTYSTPHSQTLSNHMRRHNGEKPYTCECGKNFTQASSLAAHRKTHSPTSYFTCSQCGKQFKHAFSLKTHLRVHESGNFSCTLCNKLLKSKETLRAHLKRHYKVYDYNCEDCGDTFVTSAELHNHRLKHNTDKKIICHICDYSTNTKKTLIMHLKRHAGDKPFKCNFCDKVFYTQGNLRKHMRVHTQEKPFACHTCSQRFRYSTSLNKHMQTVHGIQYKWGDVKWKEARMKKVLLKPT